MNAAAPAPVQRPRSPQRRSYKQHYYDASTPAVPMHICPLGGLGEVGKNITLYECQGDMILVDCGLVFPDSDMFGVDLVIPDFTYVLENKDRIKGLFITHGHEDHIGSLPYLLKKFNVPIYTARLTIGLIKNKLEEHGLASSAEFHEIRPRQKVRLGCFTVEPIHVNHSIPDSLAFAIDCPAGIVLHTGDFKIDYTPLSGDAVTDLSTIAEYAAAACWLCWRILPTRNAPALRQPSRLWPKGCAACLPAPKTAALSWQPLLPTSTASSRSLTWPLSMAARWPSMAAAWFPTPKWRGSWGICMRRIMC